MVQLNFEARLYDQYSFKAAHMDAIFSSRSPHKHGDEVNIMALSEVGFTPYDIYINSSHIVKSIDN